MSHSLTIVELPLLSPKSFVNCILHMLPGSYKGKRVSVNGKLLAFPTAVSGVEPQLRIQLLNEQTKLSALIFQTDHTGKLEQVSGDLF